ncbi:hypothetical protein M5689_021611 [Euphorbia peplus]|nr:hypothetical protein M5689_021611 [Euphorbia peplus]
MERKILSFVLLWVMIFGVFSGQSKAISKAFDKCMDKCIVGCIIPPWTPICPATCLARCIIQPGRATIQNTPARFCTLGCATSVCSKLITKDNFHLDEVESCANTCSGSCNKNYVP